LEVTGRENNLAAVFPQLTQNAQLEIEKIFIGSYFANKHYIHPILSKGSFMKRCEGEAWPSSRRAGLFKGVTAFSGLYLAVVALGAINASPNETSLLDHFCQQTNDQTRGRTGAVFSALDFAKFYFGLARQTMGDLFESSCLETAQALLLLVGSYQPCLKNKLTSNPRVYFVKIHYSLIAVTCTVEWLFAQQQLLDLGRVCLRCLLVLDGRLDVHGGVLKEISRY
jgi:hypothetical protein